MRPTPGSPFRPDRRLTGELIDLAQQRVQRVPPRPKRRKGHRLRDYKQALVRNDHTAETAIPQFGIIELSSHAITPTETSQIVGAGTEPTDSAYAIAIAQEPIPFGVAKKCTVSGVSVCQVYFPEGGVTYKYAKKITGDITKLEASEEDGQIEILNPRTYASQGDYWVLVRLQPSQFPNLDEINAVRYVDCCQIPCADDSILTVNPAWDTSGFDWAENYVFSFESTTNPFWRFATGEWKVTWDAGQELWVSDNFTGPCGNTGVNINWHWVLQSLDDPNASLAPGTMAVTLVPTTNLTDCISGQDVVGLAMVNRYEFVPACANYMVLKDSGATSYYASGGSACSMCIHPVSPPPPPIVTCGGGGGFGCGSSCGGLEVPFYISIEAWPSPYDGDCCNFENTGTGINQYLTWDGCHCIHRGGGLPPNCTYYANNYADTEDYTGYRNCFYSVMESYDRIFPSMTSTVRYICTGVNLGVILDMSIRFIRSEGYVYTYLGDPAVNFHDTYSLQYRKSYASQAALQAAIDSGSITCDLYYARKLHSASDTNERCTPPLVTTNVTEIANTAICGSGTIPSTYTITFPV